MNHAKLRSDEVPEKFTDWLLYMGCPADKIPPADKVAQMCRGQYYMVWRSLMERAQSKDVIKNKKMQVFLNDKKLNENSESTFVPEELAEWKKHQAMHKEVEEAEQRVAQARQTLTQLMDKVSSKLAQVNLVRSRVQDAQRRLAFLQAVTDDMKEKTENFVEIQNIAESLFRVDDSGDIEAKLDKCLSLLSQQQCEPVASSSVNNGDDELEQHLDALSRAPAAALWERVCARRAALAPALAAASPEPTGSHDHSSVTPQSVVAHTAALHSLLSLETLKNKLQLKQTTARLEDVVTSLSSTLSGPVCELLVLRSERASAAARAETARALLGLLRAGGGVFRGAGAPAAAPGAPLPNIAQLDKDIIRKKEELMSIISTLATMDHKIVRARENLLATFSSLQKPITSDTEKYKDLPLDKVSDPIMAVRQFYHDWREKNAASCELSMEMDTSDAEIGESMEYIAEPTIMDELNFYSKKFNLEKNRKLVLESGEKIWIFETMQSSADRLYEGWLKEDTVCSLLCPSVRLSANVSKLLEKVREKGELDEYLKAFEGGSPKRIEFASDFNKSEEESQVDAIKKRLADSLATLQKTSRTLDLGRQNLELWSNSPWREFLSGNRTVGGKTYKEYEAIYLENLNPAA